MNHNEAGFNYPLPQVNEHTNLNLSPEVTAALGKNALGATPAENLLGEVEYIIKKLKEDIEAQAETSRLGSTFVIGQINTFRMPGNHATSGMGDMIPGFWAEEFEQHLDAKLEEWSENGSLAWCANHIKQNGGEIILVATPNTLVTPDELIYSAREFGNEQPEQTFIYEELYRKYSPEELSGPILSVNVSSPLGVPSSMPTLPVRLSLIPTALDPNLQGTVQEQRIKLQELQTTNPSLNLKVPSPLDGITHWYSLRSKGDKLDDDTTFDRTCIRHFDLDEKKLGGWSRVPSSYVIGDGRPSLDELVVGGVADSRFAVG